MIAHCFKIFIYLSISSVPCRSMRRSNALLQATIQGQPSPIFHLHHSRKRREREQIIRCGRFLWAGQGNDNHYFNHMSLSDLEHTWPLLTARGPVHHQLPEFTQTHIHRVSDAIQPSHPLSSPSPPAPNPSQHQSLFQ